MTEAEKMLKVLRLNTFIQIERGKLSLTREGKEYQIDVVDLEGKATSFSRSLVEVSLTDDEIDLLFGRTFTEKNLQLKP